jgi:hypothetical protein
MRRGFAQPTVNSTSRTSSTGIGPPVQQATGRLRQTQHEAPGKQHSTGDQNPPRTRRKSDLQPTLSLPQQSDEAHLPPARKSPAYLQGKNPYGQVLDRIEHPYRETTASKVEPPSQIGASAQGRPRTTGAFDFKTRSSLSEAEREVSAPDPEPRPLPRWQPAKPVSVQAAKKFFESKASLHQSPPHVVPPGVAALVKGTPANHKQLEQPSKTQLRPVNVVASKSVGQEEELASGKFPVAHGCSLPERESIVEGDPGSEEATVATLVADREGKPPNQNQSLGEIVRRCSTCSSAAESTEAAIREDHTRPQEGRRPGPDYEVRGTVEDNKKATSNRVRHRPFKDAFPDESVDVSAKHIFQDYKPGQRQDDIGGRVGVQQKVEHFTARGLSHDGSSSNPSLSHRDTTHDDMPTYNVTVQSDDDNVEVPDHVDWRGAYGRRKAQDFGFPGARIRHRGPNRNKLPLTDPGGWSKRSCGHFSHTRKFEVPEDASLRCCQQCKVRPSSTIRPPKGRIAYKRAITDSPRSRSSMSTIPEVERERYPRHQHWSGRMPTHKCGDTFARDLGQVIDAILEEHTNSLQSVINNIRQSQPSLAQLRRVSRDLVQRCQMGGVCTNNLHPSCAPPHAHQSFCRLCQPVCQPVCQSLPQPTPPEGCEWQSQYPFPYCPPKAAEKLNAGAPGQLGPNLNDSRSSLRQAVQTVPSLVDLVNSAADNLGVDLDRRPTARDEQAFQEAPVQGYQRGHLPSNLSDHEEQSVDNEQPGEDRWLQQTRRYLSELSEARTQMMDELDSFAKDLGIQLQGPRTSEGSVDPVQQTLNEVNTAVSRRSTQFMSEPFKPSARDFAITADHPIDEQRVSRVLTRIKSQSRRTTGLTDNSQEFVGIPLENIQEWVDMAQIELPAAIDSITNVLETLPTFEYFPIINSPQEQPLGEPTYDEDLPDEPTHESDPDFHTEPEALSKMHDDSREPSQRSHTHSFAKLQDRDVEPERGYGADTVTSVPSSVSPSIEPWMQKSVKQDLEEREQPVKEDDAAQPRFAPTRRLLATSTEVGTDQSFSSDL